MKDDSRQMVDVDHIIVRPYPKVVLLYPIALVALVCGCVQAFAGKDQADLDRVLGLVFLAVSGFNMLVFSFEFTRIKTVTIAIAIVAAVFAILYFGERWPIVQYLREFVVKRDFTASTEFYLGLFVYFALVFVGVLINTRFDYWEVRHNEILHHTGFLGQVRRFPSPNLKMTKEINDVFEYMLLRCGRMILYPASEKEAIVLENVLNVNTVERNVHALLSSLAVEIDIPQSHREEEDGPGA